MSLTNPRYFSGADGINRNFGPGDAPKVQRMGQQHAYRVAVDQITQQQVNLRTTACFTPPMETYKKEHWYPLTGEPAVKLRGSTSDEVFTALNGLDASAREEYPGDPEMARLIVRSKVQVVGIVDQSARTDLLAPMVTLKIGGSVPQYAPGEYNFGDLVGQEIGIHDMIVYEPPRLDKPIIAGFPQKIGKIVMVPRPASKESMSHTIMLETAHIIHDPSKYKRAMASFEHIANSKIHTAVCLRNCAFIQGLMMVDMLLARGILTMGDDNLGQVLAKDMDAAPGPAQAVQLDPKEHSATIVARLAEAISLMQPSESNIAQPGYFSANLTDVQQAEFRKLEYDLGQRLFPLQNPDTGKFNISAEFGTRMNDDGKIIRQGRDDATGMTLRTPIGQLLDKSTKALPLFVQAVAMAFDEETRNRLGFAASAPNQAGTGLFDLIITPAGGLSAKFI